MNASGSGAPCTPCLCACALCEERAYETQIEVLNRNNTGSYFSVNPRLRCVWLLPAGIAEAAHAHPVAALTAAAPGPVHSPSAAKQKRWGLRRAGPCLGMCCCAEGPWDPGEPGWLPPDPGALSMEGMRLVAWGSQSVAQNRWRCPVLLGLVFPYPAEESKAITINKKMKLEVLTGE